MLSMIHTYLYTYLNIEFEIEVQIGIFNKTQFIIICFIVQQNLLSILRFSVSWFETSQIY